MFIKEHSAVRELGECVPRTDPLNSFSLFVDDELGHRYTLNIAKFQARLRNLTAIHIQNRPSFAHLDPHIDRIAIVGSSGAGKSTIIAALRGSALYRSGIIDIPLRFTTRPTRLNDSKDENVFVSSQAFRAMADAGKFALHWQRIMEGGRLEGYAFARTATGALPVYSANNALYDNADTVRPVDFAQNTLYIGIYAPDTIRARRLAERSPDLSAGRPAEFNHRLADRASNMLPHIDIRVDNFGPNEQVARREVIKLIEDTYE